MNPNMDEVVRQEQPDSAETEHPQNRELSALEKQNWILLDENIAARKKAKALEAANRLLIEEREQLLADKKRADIDLDWYKNTTVFRGEQREELKAKVAEQDKEIQRLQKLEDVMKLFKLNGATDIFYWLEEAGIDL